MSYQPKKRPRDELAIRRAEILAEYRRHQLEPIKIGGEPISLELALLLGLIVDLAQPSHEAAAE